MNNFIYLSFWRNIEFNYLYLGIWQKCLTYTRIIYETLCIEIKIHRGCNHSFKTKKGAFTKGVEVKLSTLKKTGIYIDLNICEKMAKEDTLGQKGRSFALVDPLIRKISNHVAWKIFFEYSRKIKQDSSMAQSPANLVRRVSWPSNSFDSANSVFFSTINTIGKLRDLWDKVNSPTSFDSISLQQIVATPTRTYSSY